MNPKISLHSIFAVYITQVTALCNLYLFFSATRSANNPMIPMVPWLFLAILNFGVVYLFLRKERAFAHLVYLGVFCYVILTVIMSLFFVKTTGIISWFIIWCFLAIPSAMACTLNLSGVKPQTVLLCCECPAMGLALLLFMGTGGVFAFPAENAICTGFALLFSFISLTMHKLEGKKEISDGKKKQAIATIISCFIGLGLLSAAFVSFALDGTAKVVNTTTNWVITAITWILFQLNRFVEWFFSLFPTPEAEVLEISPPESNGIATAEEVMLEGDYSIIGIILIVALCVLIICLLVWVLRRFGKNKLEKTMKTSRYHRPKIKVKKESFWHKIIAFLKKKYENLKFEIRLLHMRNTPKGTMLMLIKIGKTKGYHIEMGESYRSYLLRLQQHCIESDESVKSTFFILADVLDHTLYAPEPVSHSLTKRDYKKMRIAISHLQPLKLKKDTQ
ncbi:hypothetical protein [Chakrabartyella piscis]|uniref:hypothetical protein n=1 Tax=Chakrabartyella piscis TaxID=2918914 RepID=UPI00295897A7|nr:hypothetical protein [Chakrabartyella piscis]